MAKELGEKADKELKKLGKNANEGLKKIGKDIDKGVKKLGKQPLIVNRVPDKLGSWFYGLGPFHDQAQQGEIAFPRRA